MASTYDSRYPSVEDLRRRCRARTPKFAFEYLDGGCNEDVNLCRNTDDIRRVELIPRYLGGRHEADMRTELFGHTYDAPFGIAPIGLQGLIWPKSPEILARAAYDHNIPFILSTVSTSSIEKISELTQGRAWFQLYYPTRDDIRKDILRRVRESGCQVLVLLCDVPTFGYRPRDIRNGLSLPPRMVLRNVMQMLAKPNWALQTLLAGPPKFEMLQPYMDTKMDLKQMGKFMDDSFSGWLDESRVKEIRDGWPGKLVLKGVASSEDVEQATALGVDAFIVSNHGGRQLDAGQSAIKALGSIVGRQGGKTLLMMDSGIRSGPDIARTLAVGAEFTFLGRAFMYGVAALGANGGNHTIAILKRQLEQVMRQLSCNRVQDLRKCLAN